MDEGVTKEWFEFQIMSNGSQRGTFPISDRHNEMAVDKAEQFACGDFTLSLVEEDRFKNEKCEPVIILNFGTLMCRNGIFNSRGVKIQIADD